jgi:hypothetical protein
LESAVDASEMFRFQHCIYINLMYKYPLKIIIL